MVSDIAQGGIHLKIFVGVGIRDPEQFLRSDRQWEQRTGFRKRYTAYILQAADNLRQFGIWHNCLFQ